MAVLVAHPSHVAKDRVRVSTTTIRVESSSYTLSKTESTLDSCRLSDSRSLTYKFDITPLTLVFSQDPHLVRKANAIYEQYAQSIIQSPKVVIENELRSLEIPKNLAVRALRLQHNQTS